MFKKDYTYGQVLLYFYNIQGYRCSINTLKRKIDADIEYLEEVIQWLIKDEFIEADKMVGKVGDKPFSMSDDFYRITYKGYSFIRDIKEKRSARIINSVGIFVACVSIVISSAVTITNSQKITKVEIVNAAYLPNINKHDAANPIKSPKKHPVIIKGKSDHTNGKPQ
ncbi:MAG: hypothetical protein ACHQF4_00320 [Sphingobacteriales bacterium]